MYRTIMVLGFLWSGLYGYGAVTKQEQCLYLEKLPKESKAFYKKFKDIDATLMLYQDLSYALHGKMKPDCLTQKSFDNLLKEYSSLQALSGNIRELERLYEVYPDKLFLIRYLADAYKKSYLSPQSQNRERDKHRILAIESYNRYLSKGGKVGKDIKRFLATGGLQKAKNRWFGEFNVGKVPLNRYKVFYFNNKNRKVFKQDVVPYPVVNYAHSKFPNHKIRSEDFAAYWVGDFSFDKAVDKVLNFEVSWAEYRLIIDGLEVSKRVKSGGEVPYHFSRGKHRIEIEYINNYGATDFMMSMYEKKHLVDAGEVKRILGDEAYKLLYVGLYESDNFDKSVRLDIKEKYSKPVVLVVNSYSDIDWRLFPHFNSIKAIFINSYNGGSIISSTTKKPLDRDKVYELKNFAQTYSLGRKCRCSGVDLYCDGRKIADFNKRVHDVFGKKIDGYTTLYPKERYHDRLMMVPEIDLNSAKFKEIQQQEITAKKITQECNLKKSMGIDDTF